MCAQVAPEQQCPDHFWSTYRARQQAISDLRASRVTPSEFKARYLDAGRWINPGDAQVAAEGARY